ncbi:OLC1v1022048C1 [Oldenlandia corymbosa var. corymbosa]|nr:OLC1v1022048C1 [Oldenlandia corymbosa var. corymbosa]
MISSFNGHVALMTWLNQSRGCIKLQNRAASRQSLITWKNELPHVAKEKIIATGLSHLPDIMYPHLETGLICAFVERWQPNTNTFHMPFREITIMLHDVQRILGIKVDGNTVSTIPKWDIVKKECLGVLGVTEEELASYWKSGAVVESFIPERCKGKFDTDTQATAWMWNMLGAMLFVDKSGGGRVHAQLLHEVYNRIEGVREKSWASATLAYLYRQLGIARRRGVKQMEGCMTLLQAWIYEYFPIFQPHSPYNVESGPRATAWTPPSSTGSEAEVRLSWLRRQLDNLSADEVTWQPFGKAVHQSVPKTIYTGWIAFRDIVEPYVSGSVLRKLGYVQTVPRSIVKPPIVFRPWSGEGYKVGLSSVTAANSWDRFP